MPRPWWGARVTSGAQDDRGRGRERRFGKAVWMVLAMGAAVGVSLLVLPWWYIPFAFFLPLLLGVCLLLGLVLWWSDRRDAAAWRRLDTWIGDRRGREER